MVVAPGLACITDGATARGAGEILLTSFDKDGTQFFADPKERLVVVVGTAAPGELRKYYREQVQDIVYGAMVR